MYYKVFIYKLAASYLFINLLCDKKLFVVKAGCSSVNNELYGFLCCLSYLSHQGTVTYLEQMCTTFIPFRAFLNIYYFGVVRETLLAYHLCVLYMA